MDKQIHLFVPGRLCLFGEHSDWAGMYRTFNADIVSGIAVVSGTEQGIYATAEKADRFIMSSSLDIPNNEYWECEMDTAKLLEVARQGGFFSYVAGVASYINDNYMVGGIRINIYKRDLPIKSGLSSSAAICVLVARAFNQLYSLNMNIKGEMETAFRGEQRTPSRCGRLDQVCAYGAKTVLISFNGLEVDSRELRVGTTFHWVVADLMGSKDTIKILSDLGKAYPFASNDIERNVQEALGKVNQRIVLQAVKYLEEGNSIGLGELMRYSQQIFDEKVSPACSELKAPILHSVLNDQNIEPLIFGAKGVGSQGDGTVQFLTKGKKEASQLKEYLSKKYGMPSYDLTIKPSQAIRKAIIPLAGFGTRVFPASKAARKCFFPLIDEDGLLKPALLIILEQLIAAGIEEICLVVEAGDKEVFERFFSPIPEENREALSASAAIIEKKIVNIGRRITYVFQNEHKGFGHAVWLAKQFANCEPVLLLLGDFVYYSNTDRNCCEQIIDAFKECQHPLVSITPIPLDTVKNYGILHGNWADEKETMMIVDSMIEKPSYDYAKKHMGMPDRSGQQKYYATFGQYVLTHEVFEELERQITIEGLPSEGYEYGLTAAIEVVRKQYGIRAFVPDGESYDIGLPEAYRRTVLDYGENRTIN